jgi:hypothetical protein
MPRCGSSPTPSEQVTLELPNDIGGATRQPHGRAAAKNARAQRELRKRKHYHLQKLMPQNYRKPEAQQRIRVKQHRTITTEPPPAIELQT